ncbi:mannose-1-phosphate guanyltransferase [Pelotomaculum propionicicum]|uniref:UTP--glucose-1-phosphate uridylyltransferase n=1 Tax=Pelotomaculum propionicicum TaxID=258475 RepID=A0A4Y7RR86_9FIRM|nr:mannose-1-phosphate guanyltransferase [Pelotomaculum propionicicum]NLI14209.1 NTP transferase domain-containing protein [Peptococcaceae bacterium]TEB11229.1 UTP--glucose-1-phosphate uridylyltransferase [Pelotomaculum propionicicum]
MKAIIMAGGEGSRLRPLTCGRPKPMVPVLNRPIMAHIIDLLKNHGFDDIGVTLQYMPEAIRDHFGNGAEYDVNLRYFVEDSPLGTAGSVKNASGFLDDTFLVISGDALTDLDLTRAVEFHKKNGSLATLVLTRVDCPLEYGVVITSEDGRITQFLEKPGWGEVFSDTVNTGIYVLEPEVLEYFAPGRMFDFSKDLFPLLLSEKKPLFGLVLPGYWCDIGNLQQYLEAHYDALSGKVKIEMPGHETLPRVWVEDGAYINPAASVKGPSLIGADCQIAAGARIEPYTLLGRGCLVQKDASIKRSVIWNNVYVGSGASLRGAVVGSRVQVQAKAGIYEGAVVGEDSIIRENSLLKPDVKLWPHKLVETGATVHRSVVWGTLSPKKSFGFEGISGLVNVEITPEFAVRIGAAFGSTTGLGARIAVSSDSYTASIMIRQALISGAQSVGSRILDLGEVITPVARYAVRSLNCQAGVHIKVSPAAADKVVMVFINSRGGNISRGQERKIENALAREDFPRSEAARLFAPEKVVGAAGEYMTAVYDNYRDGSLRGAGFKVLLCYDHNNLENFVAGLCSQLGLARENYCGEAGGEYRSWSACQKILPDMAKAVVESGADAGALLDPNGDRLVLIDEKGRVIQDNLLTALLSLIILKGREGPVVVPVTAPMVIEALAERYQGRVVRTKTALQDFLDKVLAQEPGLEGISQFFLHFDALTALVRILDYTARHKSSLATLVEEIPLFFMDSQEVHVPWEAKGRVIRRLIQDPPASRFEMLDGVKIYHQNGWALVLPDPEEPLCRVFSEGSTMEIAESLTDMYIEKINKIAGLKNP